MHFILGLNKMVDRIYIVQDTKHFSLDNADSNVEVLTLKKIKYLKNIILLVYQNNFKFPMNKPGMMVRVHNSITWKGDARLLRIQSQDVLQVQSYKGSMLPNQKYQAKCLHRQNSHR